MIYFLGGPPRVGKSIMARAITIQHGISAVSTDSLGMVLEAVLEPEAEPGLFAISRFNELPEADRIRLMKEDPATRIDYQREESAAVWRAVEPFISREQDEDRDVVVEGVAVLPELVAQLEGIDYRVVFVGNQGNRLKENIKRSANENEHDWMRHASDEYIAAFATFVAAMSSYIEREARRCRFEYVEMDGHPFSSTVARVVNALLTVLPEGKQSE
jgi:2-phosphoglycerate kinase